MTSPHRRRFLAISLGFALFAAGCTQVLRGTVRVAPQIEAAALTEEKAQEQAILRTIARMCMLLRSDGVRVRQVARRLGWIKGSDGRFGAVEFRPRHPAFSWGMVARYPMAKELSTIEVTLAETAMLSLGALQARLGPGQYREPLDPLHGVDRFVFAGLHPSEGPLGSCTLAAEVTFNGAGWSQAIDASVHALGGAGLLPSEPLQWIDLRSDLGLRLDGRIRRLILTRAQD